MPSEKGHIGDLPRISIITAVYNGEAYIEQAINSVLNQGYPNLEYIIIDGASQDRTVEVIKKYELHLAYWVSEPDSGVYEAMNKGLFRATGDIIGILNADDFYFPGTFNFLAEQVRTSNGAVYFGDVWHIQEMENQTLVKTGKPDLKGMKETMTLIHPACFVKQHVYKECGVFNTSYQVAADYDFLLRAFIQGYEFQYMERRITGFRGGGISTANCDSILEAQKIKEVYLKKDFSAMQLKYWKCRFRKLNRLVLYKLAGTLGLSHLLQKRLIKKWNR